MKILFITPYFYPSWGYGGPPLINYKLATYLASKGHTVKVLTTDALDKNRINEHYELIQDVHIHRFKNVSNYLAWNFKLFFPFGFKSYINKNIKEFDFVYLSDFRDYQNVIAHKACIKNNIKYAVAAYGQCQIPRGFRAPVKKLYDRLWGSSIIKDASLLLAQTQNEIDDYNLLGGTKEQCVLLPLGIDFHEYKDVNFTKAEISNFKSQIGVGKKDRMLLFIGRINYLKGIDRLIRILPKVINGIDNIKLVIIGRDDGYYLDKISKLIDKLELKEKVIIKGPMYSPDNFIAYQSADIFMFAPRHFEETSLSCLASLALGTPVITTKEASIPFLEEYKAGFEIEYSSQALIEKLTILLNDNNLRERMGVNARTLIEKKFDLPAIGSKLEKLIKEKL